MNRPFREDRSKEASERFDRGVKTGRTPDEDRALKDYARLKKYLRSYAPNPLDSSTLSGAMQIAMMQRNINPSYSIRFGLKPVFGVGLTFVMIACAYVYFLGKPLDPAVVRIQNINNISKLETTPSWIWERLLQTGFKVTTPKNDRSILTLSDGSTINCSPGTRLSINYSETRKIGFYSGEIVVHAAHIKGSTMSVETPYMNVQVVGTVFRLKIVG